MSCLLVLEKGSISEEEVSIGLLIYMTVSQHHFTSLAKIIRVIPFNCALVPKSAINSMLLFESKFLSSWYSYLAIGPLFWESDIFANST